MQLRKYLEDNGLTITQFAKHIGLSRNGLNYIINDRRQPSAQTLIEIYKATEGQVTPNDVLARYLQAGS